MIRERIESGAEGIGAIILMLFLYGVSFVAVVVMSVLMFIAATFIIGLTTAVIGASLDDTTWMVLSAVSTLAFWIGLAVLRR